MNPPADDHSRSFWYERKMSQNGFVLTTGCSITSLIIHIRLKKRVLAKKALLGIFRWHYRIRNKFEHLARLKEMLIRLKQATFQLHPKKCHFFQSRVKYLGHVVPSSVIEWAALFLSCIYYRRFMWNFAHIACYLHVLTERNRQFQ